MFRFVGFKMGMTYFSHMVLLRNGKDTTHTPIRRPVHYRYSKGHFYSNKLGTSALASINAGRNPPCWFDACRDAWFDACRDACCRDACFDRVCVAFPPCISFIRK